MIYFEMKKLKLRNFFITNFRTGGRLKLPVGVRDAVVRLKTVQVNLTLLSRSIFTILVAYFIPLGGSLFSSMGENFYKKSGTTCCGTSFPGPKSQMIVFERLCLDTYFNIGPSYENPGK